VELFVVVVVICLLAIVFIFEPNRNIKTRAPRIRCVNNLKEVGLAYGVWEGDHGGHYPMTISETNGGTMEFNTGPKAWRHFQVMSNELTTLRVLVCPADWRMPATNFSFLANSNISFFVGVDASETNPQGILSGDHNITNGTPVKNGIIELTTNQPTGWTTEMHNKVGNIGLADGSVQPVSISGLRSAVENAGVPTNHLQMPVLSP
jgi:hypothetical protein